MYLMIRLRWLSGKESTCQSRKCGLKPWVWKIPWRRKWQPTPVFLPGKSWGLKSLMGYSPWGHKRIKHNWATKQTKRLPFNFILSSERRIQNVILVWLSILELFSKENKLQRNEYVLRLPIAKVHLELFFFIFEEGLKFNSKRLYDGQSKRRRGDKVNPDIIHSLFTRTQCSDLKYSPPTLTCHWKDNVCCTEKINTCSANQQSYSFRSPRQRKIQFIPYLTTCILFSFNHYHIFKCELQTLQGISSWHFPNDTLKVAGLIFYTENVSFSQKRI